MQGALGQGATVRFTPELYLAGRGAVQRVLAEVPDDVHTVMIIGHNPGWEEVVEEFTGHDVELTTCNAALLRLDAESWARAASQAGRWAIEDIVRPKAL
jgi:phosphohistidine phosphatase